MKAIIFLLVLFSFSASGQISYSQDSIILSGGSVFYKRATFYTEEIRYTAIIHARRLELQRKLSDLIFELEYLDDLKAQFEDAMGGMSILSGERAAKQAPVKEKPKKEPADRVKASVKPKKRHK